MRSDCGQLTGDEAEKVGKKVPDITGDPYEDYPEDHSRELKGPEVFQIASELKEFGNKAFKANDLPLALAKYQKGVRYLNEYPEALPDDPETLSDDLTQLRFNLHSNSALLQIKLRANTEALSSTNNALELEGGGISNKDRAKASYRKALALLGLKDEEEAVKTLETAQKLAPGDAAITKELNAAKQKAAEHAKKEKAQYKKFFS